MNLQIDLNTLIVTIIAAIIIGFFWRIFSIPEKYMSKTECDRRRAGDNDAIKAMTISLNAVHERVDDIFKIIAENGEKNVNRR